MVIISENKKRTLFVSSQVRYALTYVVVTFFVLLFLNIYSSQISQRLFYQSKEASMIERCKFASTAISDAEVLNATTAAKAASELGFNVSRLIITNQNGTALYDSATDATAVGKYVVLPEIVKSLDNYDVFSWSYHNGTMQSCAATPIVSYGNLIGSVYMMEYDTQQGALIQTLQKNTFTITLILEILVILFSLAFSKAFSSRLRKIMATMRIIREGNYSEQVIIGGNDELNVLSDEFNDLLDRLRTSEQKRNNFVSDASHELKTPLASIKLLSDSILQNDMDIETTREFVQDIGNEADRLNRMSQKLLSLSHIESQADSDCEIIHISSTITRVIRMLSALADKNRIKFHTDLQDDCPILILEDDLYQIVFNLVENGIKYNTPGGALFISLQRREDNAVLSIKDTGVGIPHDSLPHIFERFYRVDKARSRKSGGSGLGLAIVRIMVERNHGQIHVDSVVGIGTEFVVTFPIFDTEENS